MPEPTTMPVSTTSAASYMPAVACDKKGNAVALWIKLSTGTATLLVDAKQWKVSDSPQGDNEKSWAGQIFIDGNGTANIFWGQYNKDSSIKSLLTAALPFGSEKWQPTIEHYKGKISM